LVTAEPGLAAYQPHGKKINNKYFKNCTYLNLNLKENHQFDLSSCNYDTIKGIWKTLENYLILQGVDFNIKLFYDNNKVIFFPKYRTRNNSIDTTYTLLTNKESKYLKKLKYQ
jgi:hypothetical protein